MDERLKITVIATGFPPRRKNHAHYTIERASDPFRAKPSYGSTSPAQQEIIDWERPAYMHWKSRKLK
jgi:hypothetical protein